MSFKKGIKQKEVILRDPTNPIVFLDLKIGQENVGCIVIELYKHAVPSTAENFRALCTGEVEDQELGKPLHYKGSLFHKLMPHFMYQAGDIVNFDGSSGYSIYGPKFELENFTIPHDEPGILSMVNIQETYCNSQFIITSTECPHLNGRSVAFGRVIKGFSCVQQMGEVKTVNHIPQVACVIQNCGELRPEDIYTENGVDDGSEDTLPHGPCDLELDLGFVSVHDLKEIVNVILLSGKTHYRNRNFINSDKKFRKGIRYIDWIGKEIVNMQLEEESRRELTAFLEQERHTSYLNLSGTALELGDWKQCLQYCDMVLAKDGNNPKALYRKGRALLIAKDYSGALAAQTRALQLKPKDSSIVSEIQKIQRKRATYLAEEKQIFSKMFDFKK